MHAVGKNKMFKIYCPTYLGRPRHGFVTSVCVLVCVFCQMAPMLFCQTYESVVFILSIYFL